MTDGMRLGTRALTRYHLCNPPRKGVTYCQRLKSIPSSSSRCGFAFVGTLLGLPIGLAVAWVLAKTSVRGKVLLDTLVSFPLVLPPVVTGYALLLLLGRNGPLAGLQQSLGVELLFTWFAAAMAAGLVALPLMVRSMEVAMAGVDTRLELAARTLGASRWKVFTGVTVPLAFRGIAAGTLLAFARGLGEFGATIIVAGKHPGAHADPAPGHLHQPANRRRCCRGALHWLFPWRWPWRRFSHTGGY